MTVQSYEELYQIWQKFIFQGLDVPEANSAVAASWQRSRQLGVDPFAGNPSVDERALDGLINENRLLLEVVTPFIEVIDNFVQNTGFILTLTDQNGIVIKVSGDSVAVERAKCNLLVEGARRGEKDAGTNAISLALTENRPIQTVGPQHYKQCHHDWTCSAAPIHDTQARNLLQKRSSDNPMNRTFKNKKRDAVKIMLSYFEIAFVMGIIPSAISPMLLLNCLI